MALRTSVKLFGATLGVAALAGASQLGLAYGLGILRLTRVLEVTARDQWTAQLAWVAWFAMVAAVVGAMAGRPHLPAGSGAGTRIATALTAGLGAAVVVPLTMQPARTAQVAGVHPVFVIGVCAGLGALAGVFAAYAAVSRPVARWSFTSLGIAVWVIAIVSVAPSLAPSDPLPAVRLGVFDAGFLAPSVTQRTALFTMPALALIGGAVLGWQARRRSLSTLTIALSGLAGPALLTAAYLVAGPGSGNDRYQVVPYWAAMTAAGAGVLGSVLAAVLRRGPSAPETPAEGTWSKPEEAGSKPEKAGSRPKKAGSSKGKAGSSKGGAEPTDDRPPLPRRDIQAESAIAQAATAAALRPEEQLRPSDTGVFTKKGGPAFDGFTPPQAHGRVEPEQISPPLPHPTPVAPPPQVRGRRSAEPDSVADWVSGLGNG
jgi:hypothetical protein